MAIKTHKVTLSLDNPRVIQSGINVQSFDKQSIQISIELTKNDEVFQVPSDATIRVSLLKPAHQEQKIIVDVPNTNRDSIDWIVPDYLDGYQGTVRVGVYLVSGAENVDLGYFTILSNVSDIDKMADEFTDNVFQGWEQIEADLNELNLTIAQTKLDLADDLTQIDNTIANINTKNTQVNTLASDFEADVATKQSDVTSKYNAFDTSVTTANQTIDDILGLADDVQQVSAQLAEKVQNFKLKNEVVNGDFSQGTTGWLGSSALEVQNVSGKNYISITRDLIGTKFFSQLDVPINNKFYVRGILRYTAPNPTDIRLFFSSSLGNYPIPAHSNVLPKNTPNVDILATGIVDTAGNTSMYIGGSSQDAGTLLGRSFMLINLTPIFGAGNEPTKEEMDRLVAMVPNQWWDGELDLTQQQYVNWLLSFIREKANKDVTVYEPTLQSGYVSGSGGIEKIRVYKDSFGFVHIEGRVEGSQLIGGSNPIFTLPLEFRPKYVQTQAVLNNSIIGSFTKFRILTSSGIAYFDSAPTTWTFINVSYYAGF